MSKAKDNYYELIKHLDKYNDGIVPDVSEYVTELEKKSEMCDKMLNRLGRLFNVPSNN